MRMKNHCETDHRNEPYRAVMMLFRATVCLLNCISPAAAQKEKKKKKDETPAADSSKTLVPLSDEQQIDYMLSEMLGAWQVGDVEKLHSTYADDVSLVNGSWAPPGIGWTNYMAVYQKQRTHIQRVRLDRMNTYIKVNGNTGWAADQ